MVDTEQPIYIYFQLEFNEKFSPVILIEIFLNILIVDKYDLIEVIY